MADYPGKSFIDFLLRHQIFLERVKSWHAADAMRYLRELARKIGTFLKGRDITSLGELTKAQLTSLQKKVADVINKDLGNYGNQFLAEFRRFARLDTIKQKGIFSLLEPAKDFTGATIGSVWKAVNGDAVPAFGKTVKEAAEDWINTTRERVRTRINQGAIDNEALADTVKAINGEDNEFTNGTLRAARNDIRAFIATSFQQAAAKVTEFLGKIAYDCYIWISIIDNRTSEICTSRDQQVYRYGEGPQPPAHQHCRSHTVPCPCNTKSLNVPQLNQWLQDQDSEFLDAAFGQTLARRIRAGAVNAREILSALSLPGLSLGEFEATNFAVT